MKASRDLVLGSWLWGRTSPIPRGMVMVGAVRTERGPGALLRTQNGEYVQGRAGRLGALEQHEAEEAVRKAT